MHIVNSTQDPNENDFEFQENGSTILINPSMTSAEPLLAQQSTRVGTNVPSNDGNEPTSTTPTTPTTPTPPSLVNDDDSIKLRQNELFRDLSLFSAANKEQRLEEPDTPKISDRTQDGQQIDEKPQPNKTLSETPQERNAIPTGLDQFMMTNINIFTSIGNDTEVQKDKSIHPQFDIASKPVSVQDPIRKKPNDNIPMMKTNSGNDIKKHKRMDSKENIRKVLENQRSRSKSQTKLGKNLDEHIPGLYRLLDLCKDDGSNGLVDKIIISKNSLKKLCNDMVPLSFKSISEINYTKLNSVSFRLIGCYGNHTLIAKLLLNKRIINQQIHDFLVDSKSPVNDANKPSLRPGIYLLMVNPDLGLVIHWPEVGCYEENTSSQRKKNMTNLHRYLTKLTDHQLCLMSDKDLESFDWNLGDSDVDSDDDDDACYEFEVKKSQEEQENFKIYPGFKVNLSNDTKTEINNTTQDDVPLHPIVVESTTNQSFVTRKLMTTAKTIHKTSPTFNAYSFSQELRKRLQGHSLYINRESMDITQLKLLVEDGFKMGKELLQPYHDKIRNAKSQMEMKKDREKNAVKEDAEIISRMAWKRLRDSYSVFEDYIEKENPTQENDRENILSDKEIQRIQSKYPKIEDDINEIIKISSQNWRKLKKRYALAYYIILQVFNISEQKSDKMTESGIQEFYNIFVDEEKDTYSLVKKYERQSHGFFYSMFSTLRDKFVIDYSHIQNLDEGCKNYAHTKSDSEFVRELLSSPFFGDNDNVIRLRVLSAFFDEYQKWRKQTFSSEVKRIMPKFVFNKQLENKFEEELAQEKKEINNQEFERICSELEKKYKDGPLCLNILNVTPCNYKSFRLTHELETTQPNQLQITIYETSLDQSDTLQIQNDEFHIPAPSLTSNYQRRCGVTFQIDPAIYDFRKISQFDNRKFLLVLHNKQTQKIEIFFDAAQQLARNFKSSSIKPFKPLNVDENFLIAINEPRELIAIYNTKKAELNVFAFNDDQARLYSRNSNIQLLQWYSDVIPNIQHFLFIKDTEELCFVEKGGRSRIFSLVTMQFRPAVCNLPSNTENVLSSPDGSCIVAFVKERLVDNNLNLIDNAKRIANDDSDSVDLEEQNKRIIDDTEDSDNDSDISTNNEQQQNDPIKAYNVKEICRVYVYFCANFGGPVSKVIDLPSALQSLDFLQFTCLNRLQTHLMSLDLQNGHFNSAIVKITLEKTQYRFQERTQKRSLGLVRLIDTSHKNIDYTIIEGKNTHFEKIVQIGEYIVLMGEKFGVTEVISDTRLKIAGNFKSIIGYNNWMEFRIEPKTKLNGLIDAYKLMFGKYPVESCIDPEQNRPLNLKIVLDVDDEEIDKYGERFRKYIDKSFDELIRSTKKPATILKKFSTSIITFQELDIESWKFQKKFSSEHELGEWIIQLCCLIPIQIAVARNNLFQPLKDGLSSNDVEIDDDYGNHMDSIAKNISFGWYEGIFRHFGDKKVKVVSSMGEQSCGKSFMLNHLIGTTFDGSAMRCTEGVWMSLVNTKECIYVALDFEGLKSLERTPQEDLFLTLFNTVVSNLILFKNQFAVNRDMSSMFQRFQDGATLFESDPKIFQAKLCIIIKDVPKDDKEEIVKEFQSKFSRLVADEGEDNFISKMYKGGLDIIPWPMFNDAAWFKTLSNVNKKLNAQKVKYENARTFLQNTKVIMTKLKICDWGSLDENLTQIRVATLKRLLPTVISYGIEQKGSITEQLINRDTGEPIDDPIVNLSYILQDFENPEKLLLPDAEIRLRDDDTTFVRLSRDLRDYYEYHVQPRKESSDDTKWFANLDGFFKYIIERRVSRAQNWYMQNTAKFPQDNSDIVNGKYAMEQEISKLTLLWTLCGLTCHQCGLKCVKNRDHRENHDCLTDHMCHFSCQFKDAHTKKSVPKCSYKAGHEGNHACDEIDHLCGKPCDLSDKRNCQKVCAKEIGHDDEHLCQSTRHYCGKSCSLSTETSKGNYNCPNKCIIPYEEDHDLHRCENETCPIPCPMPDCQRRCQSNDHFHSNPKLSVDHFCGNEHQCLELCEAPGFCKVTTEPKKKEEVYKGLVTNFTYTKYIQIHETLRCNKKIPSNKFKHEGKHIHDEDGFHYCDKKCPFCEYYCILPYGHTQQIHDTRHGNMIQTEFTGEDIEFEYAGHRLRVGDQGTFVLCNLHCKDSERHRHIDYCKNENNCKLLSQGQDIQHINERVHPNPDEPKDFISHKLFWERTGFKDPYSVQEQQEFAKCDHECPDDKHHKSKESANVSKSFCELSLFHAPLSLNSNPPNNIGYISSDGHHFNCENPSTREAAFHIIFALDRSGSMSGRDKRPIPDHPIYNELFQSHNNRRGAVYQAVYQFMKTRINTATQNQVSSTTLRDTISLILFDHNVIVPYENRYLTETDDLLNIMLRHKDGGGTNFDLAIQKAGYLITSYFDPTKVNIIIFLSDGECSTPTNQLHKICNQNRLMGSPLYLYTVLFSSDLHSHSLEEMARIAQTYHSQNSSSSVLRCQFTHAMTEVSLVNHFTSVAESLRKHRPSLLTKK